MGLGIVASRIAGTLYGSYMHVEIPWGYTQQPIEAIVA